MQNTTRRRVLPDPVPRGPKTGFVVAEHGHTHGQVNYYLWDPVPNRIHLVDGHSHVTPSRSIAWSNHGVLATGLASGAIHLLDVERWTQPRSADYVAGISGAPANSYSHVVNSVPATPGAGSLGSLSIRHNRACNTLAFSKVDPHYLVAGYDKTRSECSLMIWDLELALSHGAYPSVPASAVGSRRFPLGSDGRLDIQIMPGTGNLVQPIQQLLPSETINCVETLHDSVSLVLASSNAKLIRLLDLRTRIPSTAANTAAVTPQAHAGITTYQPTIPSRLSASIPSLQPPAASHHTTSAPSPAVSAEMNVGWSTTTRAVYNLVSSRANPYLVASNEEGLGGIVRIWDTRYAHSDVLNLEAGRGGVSVLQWDEDARGRGGQRLGVGTRDGGVLVYDVVSGDMVSDSTTDSGEDRQPMDGSSWAAVTHVRGASKPIQPLAAFTFLPSPSLTAASRKSSAQNNVITVCRDGTMFVDTLRLTPCLTTSKTGATAIVPTTEHVPREITPNEKPDADPSSYGEPLPVLLTAATVLANAGGADSRRAVSRGRQPEPASASGNGAGGPRATLNIKQLSLNDPPVGAGVAGSYAGYGVNAGTAWRHPWTRSPSRGAAGSTVSRNSRTTTTQQVNERAKGRPHIEELDQEVWADMLGEDIGVLMKRKAEAGFGLDLMANDFIEMRVPTTGGLLFEWLDPLDPSVNPEYMRALNAVLADRQVDFVEAGLVSDGLKAPHRRLMLAICGELTGERLDIEIARIAQTQVTKAACIALFNKKTQTAVSMLHNSKDEKHRLMGTLLMQKRIEPASVLHMELTDPYLRAMVKSLAGDTSWGEILYDTDLPLLERIVLAIRFVGDDMLSRFLEEQARRCLEDGSLHGIVLLGLTTDGIHLVQRYLDRTGDIQTAAIIGALIPNKIGNVSRWIETYRDMLDGWKCFKARVRFDMMRGSIARYYGENIKTPKQVLLRCNYCQKDLTGNVATNRYVPGGRRGGEHVGERVGVLPELSSWRASETYHRVV
ncbi:hypothetical protein QFC19_000619 [Naganishia cerealis]|uniref:Uncharacterized protein n=1 Tax=Naganishia cerealis TaxID=610337 RepID=A0ACC2WLI6_9TREE|nr:hypothetical protein QFC19_000619 [Naganishia cerealis]